MLHLHVYFFNHHSSLSLVCTSDSILNLFLISFCISYFILTFTLVSSSSIHSVSILLYIYIFNSLLPMSCICISYISTLLAPISFLSSLISSLFPLFTLITFPFYVSSFLFSCFFFFPHIDIFSNLCFHLYLFSLFFTPLSYTFLIPSHFHISPLFFVLMFFFMVPPVCFSTSCSVSILSSLVKSSCITSDLLSRKEKIVRAVQRCMHNVMQSMQNEAVGRIITHAEAKKKSQ